MAGLGQRLAHQCTGADHAIEAGHGNHLDDGRHATPFFTDHPSQGATELHFAGGIGAVAEFVFQALDVELVARVIRAVPGQQEAGQPLVSLRQGQEGIAHRGRAKPLVAHQFISLARPTSAHRVSTGGVGAHVGAALFLGHGHADSGTGLVSDADIARVVLSIEDFRQPGLGQVRLQAQGRDTGEGHGQWATGTGFRLAVQISHGGAGHMGAGLRMCPRQRRQAMFDGGAHQFVVSRVKLHQVDAMTITVMAAEHRFVLVRQEPRFHQRPTRQRTVGIDTRLSPTRAKAARPVLQG